MVEHHHGLPRDESADRLRSDGTAVLCEDGVKAVSVVKADILLVVRVLTQRDPFLVQDLLKHPEVERLGISQDAVEIEEDGLQHVRVLPYLEWGWGALYHGLLHRET